MHIIKYIDNLSALSASDTADLIIYASQISGNILYISFPTDHVKAMKDLSFADSRKSKF